jgi:hypothetical protein
VEKEAGAGELESLIANERNLLNEERIFGAVVWKWKPGKEKERER